MGVKWNGNTATQKQHQLENTMAIEVGAAAAADGMDVKDYVCQMWGSPVIEIKY